MKQKAHARKERVTVSLSREALRFLRRTRAQAKLPSLSALFEKIVADLQARTEQKTYDEQMRAYYDSLSDAAVQEDREWGLAGEAVLAGEEEHSPADRRAER